MVIESLKLHTWLTYMAPVIFVLDSAGILTKFVTYISGTHTQNLSRFSSFLETCDIAVHTHSPLRDWDNSLFKPIKFLKNNYLFFQCEKGTIKQLG